MVALAAELLEEWREAERVLSVLPDDAPQRPAVVAAVEEMNQLYQYVAFDLNETTVRVIARTRARIAETRTLLRAVRVVSPPDGRQSSGA